MRNSSGSGNFGHSIVNWDKIPHENVLIVFFSHKSATEKTNDSTSKDIGKELAKREMTVMKAQT